MENVDILVDTHEPKHILDELIFLNTTNPKFDKFRIRKKTLNSADLVYGDLAAERKTPDDLYASIKDGRIFDEAYNMSQNFKYNYILISGNITDVVFPDKMKAVLTTLADVSIRYKDVGRIQTHFCANDQLLCYYFLTLCYKMQKEVLPHGIIKKPKQADGDETKRMLYGITGIGQKTADLILGEFKTIQRIANSPVEELTKIKGIGLKTAKHILKVLGSDKIE